MQEVRLRRQITTRQKGPIVTRSLFQNENFSTVSIKKQERNIGLKYVIRKWLKYELRQHWNNQL